MRNSARGLAAMGVALSLGAGLLAACGGSSSSTASKSTGSSAKTTTAPQGLKHGGTLTVLEGSNFAGNWPEGLEPTTNINALANQTMMNAIYGMLFEIGAGGKTIPDLASGYELSSDAKTLTIHIRQGVTFSDGSAFDAAAVAYNFKADLASSSPARPPFDVGSIDTPDTHTVVVNLKTPDGAIVNQFQDSLFNWIASPTSEQQMGLKKFAITPVGAGPFVVVSDTLGSKLVLKRNPTYWQKGRPYLDQLIFEATPTDESALEALQSGGAQAYEYMTTPQLVSGYKGAGLQVTADPGNTAQDIQLNTRIAPFNNIKARQAIYYATDTKVIAENIYGGTCKLTQSFTGPGGQFFEPTVPGYPSYDPTKAKTIVQQLGGLSFTLLTSSRGTRFSESQALEKMYEAVGMKVSLQTYADLASFIQDLRTNKWQLVPDSVGAWDPADAIGVAFFLHSGAAYSGVEDPKVDALIAQGLSTADLSSRAATYKQLASYLSQQAYLPFVCSATTWDIAAKGVVGPGLTTSIPGGDVGPEVFWEDVSVGN